MQRGLTSPHTRRNLLSTMRQEPDEATHARGGVAAAIEKCINEYYPDVQVNIEHAEGLSDCKKILALAKAGKLNGCLIEGMGCPGGCIAGAGTNIPVAKAKKKPAELCKQIKPCSTSGGTHRDRSGIAVLPDKKSHIQLIQSGRIFCVRFTNV